MPIGTTGFRAPDRVPSPRQGTTIELTLRYARINEPIKEWAELSNNLATLETCIYGPNILAG